jgi:fatty-acyl-CoA synthase
VPDGLVASFSSMVDASPHSIAVVGPDRVLSWEVLAERARRLAWHLAAEARLDRGDRIAISLGSEPEFLESVYAALSLGCVPVILSAGLDVDATHRVVDRSDAKVLVHRPARTKVARAAVKRIPKPWRPLLVDTGSRYEGAIEGAPPAREWCPPPASSEGALLLSAGASEPGTLVVWNDAELVAALRASLGPNLRGARVLSLAPLSHTLGLFAALRTLLAGGTVVLTDVEPLDAEAVWDAIAQHEVEVLSVGSTAALRTMTEALSARPERARLPRLRAVVSAAPVSRTVRGTLAVLLPDVELREPSHSPRHVDDRLRVIDLTSGRDVVPGSGAVGSVVRGGVVPVGFYGDPQRTASSLCSIGGVRYAITGERATVDEAGIIHPAAAGSVERADEGRVLFADLEEKLQKHPSVAACVVVEVDAVDPARMVRRDVVALVQVRDGHYVDEAELSAWWRARLGRFVAPARFLLVDELTPAECDPHDRDHARRRAAMLLDP